ncbi:MAG TPA: HAD family phosphatase [Thermomicrobiales bacterium]|nr:HAD family phosphatase [Thermomicrobiales bacterium]
MSSREIAAVVFDLDGLLIDSEPLQAWAWDTYAQRFGTTLRDDVLARMLGLRTVDASRIFVELLGLPVAPDVAMRERDELLLAAAPGQIAAHRGAVELVAHLRGRGVPLALATSGHRRYVDLALTSAGLSGAFDVEVTGDQVERGKPHPDIYLRAAELLSTPPERCLALEDAPNGVRAALAAGMVCFAIPDAGHPGGVDDADEVLGSLRQVLSMLEPPSPYRLAVETSPP